MAEVIFTLDGINTNIQCTIDEKMNEICEKFSNKVGRNINSLLFLYDGFIINNDLTFYQQAKQLDKVRNKLNVLVYEKETFRIKEIICPKCGDNIKLSFKDYKITLSECKNGHIIRDIFLKYFLNTQKIDENKLICNICKVKNKSNENKFYKCYSCDKIICNFCKSQ